MSRPSRITIAIVVAEVIILLSLFACGLVSWRTGGPQATGLLAFTLLRVLVIAVFVAGALVLVLPVGGAMLCAWGIARHQQLPAHIAVVVAHCGSAFAPIATSALRVLTRMLLTRAGKEAAARLASDLFDHLLLVPQSAKAPPQDLQPSTPQHADGSSDAEIEQRLQPARAQSGTQSLPAAVDATRPVQGNEPWEHVPAFAGSLPPYIALEHADQPSWHGPAAWFSDEEHTAREPAQEGMTLKKRLTIGLITMLLVVVVTGLYPFLSAAPPSPLSLAAPPTSMGMLSFGSSGQLDPLGTTGTQDLVTVDLLHLAAPPAGKADLAWLLPDGTDDGTMPLLLGTLQIAHGSAHLRYSQPDHTNLLARYSRVAITQEEAGRAPVVPSLAPLRLLATGAIPAMPTPGDEQRYSLLSHLRHLLAADPTLHNVGLGGGLDLWLYRNSGKLLEYTTAARDGWPDQSQNGTDLLRRQVIRTLDELDGSAYVGQDVPMDTPFLLDPHVGRIGLLELAPAQEPPGYLAHVAVHLQGLAQAPGHTTAQHDLAISLDQVTTMVMADLVRVREDAVQLARMDNTGLHQPEALTLLNDMVTHATAASVGQPDLITGQHTGGVTWIHTQLGGLAVIPLFPSAQR